MAAVTRSASASPSVANLAIDASLFPLKSIGEVVNFFRRALEQNEPDLTMLSIVAGYIELSLTTGDVAITAATNADVVMGNTVPFPVVTYELVAGLYKKFQSILAVVEKAKSSHNRQATREIIKKVSDVIWHSLIRSSYKDRAHLQNLYSYLSGNKLDCFGVAVAVVAGCQLLGYRDVHLAISEDHAWVVFGNKRIETIEVTWHGKGSEDKRGQDIIVIESGSWLYLGGNNVVCDRAMEVAAIVSAINISLTANSDCVEVADLQQKLLWMLYNMGHLKKYPMALGSLGELEEINATHKTITCEQLYREAIQSAREYYHNHHVYPYTYQGNYYNRLLKYRDAFASWANAADVIRLYTYNCRDDEEIYKELLDIANEMIPYVMKTESSGHSARSILRDSEVFANLLRFYDGICQWEEDSLTPILHIGWAKPLVNNITKFDYDIRSQVVIKVPEDDDSVAVCGERKEEKEHTEEVCDKDVVMKVEEEQQNHLNNDETNNGQVEGNNNNVLPKKDDAKKADIPTTLADLTAACGEKILNPEFLLQGGGKLFAEQKQQQLQEKQKQLNNHINNNNENEANGIVMNNEKAQQQQQQQQQQNNLKTAESSAVENGTETLLKFETQQQPKVAKQANDIQCQSVSSPAAATLLNSPHSTTQKHFEEEDPFEFMLKRPVITLYSQKMKGLKDLLLAEKLNTHAISLQVTAQSVASRKIRGIDKLGHHTTTSTYATVNITAAASSSSHQHQQQHHHHYHTHQTADSTTGSLAAADSIAVSRPKRKKMMQV